jgi:hypothetical protein
MGSSGEKRKAKSEKRSSNVRLVYVAPLPGARLERLHHWMSSLAEVLIGVLTGRGIAATNVPAHKTFAQLHPTLAGLETFLTALMTGLDISIGQLYMLTTCHSTSYE